MENFNNESCHCRIHVIYVSYRSRKLSLNCCNKRAGHLHYFLDIDLMLYVTNRGLSDVTKLKNIMVVKALLTSHDILLEELKKFSEAVDQVIDVSEFMSKRDNIKLINYVLQS
ncbi:hypothetical protein Fmac_011215 [Flemingia macrophylla]|uniref:Uncharacterized protein n=1 Tax=Flemingia macrophylla TaxID=520843 RepID=A0ABD1MLX1_9FABA